MWLIANKLNYLRSAYNGASLSRIWSGVLVHERSRILVDSVEEGVDGLGQFLYVTEDPTPDALVRDLTEESSISTSRLAGNGAAP